MPDPAISPVWLLTNLSKSALKMRYNPMHIIIMPRSPVP